MLKGDLLQLDGIVKKYRLDGRGLPYAHGMITSFLSAPQMIMPSQIMPAVLGCKGEMPVFDGTDEGMGFNSHFFTLYNEIAGQLQDGSYIPLLTLEKSKKDYTYKDAEEWCRGYLAAMNGYISVEDALDDENRVEMLFPITLLAGPKKFLAELSEEKLKAEGSSKDKFLENALEELPSAVLSTNDYNRESINSAPLSPFGNAGGGFDLMNSMGGSPGQVVNSQKVGRNDPCPCGSGKKHKKCCGR